MGIHHYTPGRDTLVGIREVLSLFLTSQVGIKMPPWVVKGRGFKPVYASLGG